MTLQESFEAFILSRQLADLSPKTLKAYKDFVSPFVSALGGDINIGAINECDINKYIFSLLQRPLSRSTRATYIRHIKVFLKWLYDNYTVQYNYKHVKVPKSPKKDVKIYSADELRDIFSHIHEENDWLTMRDKCIVALMYDSGLRQSEVCYLARAKVSFSENRLTVCGKGNKERIVPLGAFTAHYMHKYFELCPYESDMVFVNRRGAPLTCNAVKLLMRKLANRLDFDLSSHKLRHNFATNYCIDQYEAYGQVDIYRLMILMGHEDIETTRRYLHHANEIIGSKNCISHIDKIFGTEN